MDDLSKRIQPEWQWLSKHNLDHPSTAFSAAHDLIDIRVSKVSSDSIFHFGAQYYDSVCADWRHEGSISGAISEAV